MNHPAIVIVASLFILLCSGCEPATFKVVIESSPTETALVDDLPSKRLTWPVTDQKWQIARPTAFSFLRSMEPGHLGQLGAAQLARNQARIAAANKSQGPAPWSVEAIFRDLEWDTTIQALVGESDGMPVADKKYTLPVGCTPTDVKLDLYTTRVALLDDGIWVAPVSWPQAESEHDPMVVDEPRPQHESEPAESAGAPDGVVFQADVWKRIELAEHGGSGPIQAEFYGEAGQLVATQGNIVFLIDADQQRIVNTVRTANPILHLSVAQKTGDAAVVDSQGKIHFIAAELNEIQEIGTCDLELPMPVISPEAGRIATCKTPEVGRVYKIKDSIVTDHLDIPLAGGQTPKLICSSPAYDYWIDESGVMRRPNDPNQPGADLKSSRYSVYWEIRRAIPVGVMLDQPWLFCVAERPQPDGQTEVVAFDCEFGNREFYKPLPWSRYEDALWTISGDGWQIATVNDDHVEIATRTIKHPQNLRGLRVHAQQCTWNKQYDYLEAMAALVRSLPENRMRRTPEEMYIEIVEGIQGMWQATRELAENSSETQERRHDARESLQAAREWLAKGSTLAICCAMRSRRGKSELVEKTWQSLADRDDIPLSAYVIRISTAETNNDNVILASALQECLERYPMESAVHQMLVTRFLEYRGGTRGAASAYANAIGNAIGSPHGDLVYAELIIKICDYFAYPFFNYAFVDGQRVLAGMREGIRTERWQENDTLGCIILLGFSHSQSDAPSAVSPYGREAIQLTTELADYYRYRYPMLVKDYRDNWFKQYVVDHLPL